MQSISDLYTHQGEIIDKMLKQVTQAVNQMLCKTTTGSPASNLHLSDAPHDNTSDRQSAPTLTTSDIHKHTTTSPKTLTDQTPLNTSPHTLLQILKKKTKQIIMYIDALLHLSTLYNKILQEWNLNGLCQYDNAHQTYIFKNSYHIVNCSYILIFYGNPHAMSLHQTHTNGMKPVQTIYL